MLRKSLGIALLVLSMPGGPAWAADRVLTVFAAASLTDVLRQVGDAYTSDTRQTVRFSFAASSTLARQVEAGSPADVFVSADEAWMDYLQSRHLLAAVPPIDIAGNELVLIAPADSTVSLSITGGFPIAAALGSVGRLAIGDPVSVPAGKYAREALTHLGVWRTVEARTVAADNVRTALNFVARGEAPLGIVYATDARSEPRVRVVDVFPEAAHQPITYPAAMVRGANAHAADFLKFLQGARARGIFERAGFTRP
jgi:molybdate transport system substrate-binding protein